MITAIARKAPGDFALSIKKVKQGAAVALA